MGVGRGIHQAAQGDKGTVSAVRSSRATCSIDLLGAGWGRSWGTNGHAILWSKNYVEYYTVHRVVTKIETGLDIPLASKWLDSKTVCTSYYCINSVYVPQKKRGLAAVFP